MIRDAFDRLQQHTRYAARSLLRAPGFAMAATAIVGLGIGATATVFSVMDTVLLKPLPYPNADRLQIIETTRNADRLSVSYPDFVDFRALNHSYSDVAAYNSQVGTFTDGAGDAEVVRGQMITPNMFRMLAVRPTIGRDFLDREFAFGTPRTIIIGSGFWKRRYASDPAIVGRVITMDREQYTIIGVMPDGFDFPGGSTTAGSEFWIPTGLADAQDFGNRDSHPGLTAVARLKDGVTPERARADMMAVAARLREQYPGSNKDEGVHVDSALDSLVGDLVPALTLVTLAVLLLLVITSANMTGLLLARGVANHREIAIRTALGAPRSRIVTQLLVESLMLALMGGAAGVAVAFLAIHSLRTFVSELPRLSQITLDWRVVLFAFGASLLTGMIFGVGPALSATGTRIEAWLRTRTQGNTNVNSRARRMLVGGEIMVSFVLVVAATMLGRSFTNLTSESGGIRPDGTLSFATRLPEAQYPLGEKIPAFYNEMMTQLAQLPGVTAAGAISTLPFSGAGRQSRMREIGSADEGVRTDVAAVTPGYFAAVGMQLLRGRLLMDRDDDPASPSVAVIDERMAQRFWPGQEAIGKHLEGWGQHDRTIVGVVKHVKNYGVALDSREELFVPLGRQPMARMYTVVRTSGKPELLTSGIRAIVKNLDPQVPVSSVRTMRVVVDNTVSTPRLTAALSGTFAALSLALAGIGLYGLLAFLVGQRKHEIGVRMALGATPGAVVTQVVLQAVQLVGLGVGVGLLASLGAGRFLQSRLFGVPSVDWVTLAVVPMAFVVVALISVWIPARRAARIHPLEALRDVSA